MTDVIPRRDIVANATLVHPHTVQWEEGHGSELRSKTFPVGTRVEWLYATPTPRLHMVRYPMPELTWLPENRRTIDSGTVQSSIAHDTLCAVCFCEHGDPIHYNEHEGHAFQQHCSQCGNLTSNVIVGQAASFEALCERCQTQDLPAILTWLGLQWTLEHTGGGCTAYRAYPYSDDATAPTPVRGGLYMLVTRDDDPSAPVAGDTCIVVLYYDEIEGVDLSLDPVTLFSGIPFQPLDRDACPLCDTPRVNGRCVNRRCDHDPNIDLLGTSERVMQMQERGYGLP